MTRLGRFIPSSMLAKGRLATTLVGVGSMAGHAAQVGNRAHGWVWHAASLAAIGLIVAIIIVTYQRGRNLRLDPVLLPVLVFVAGSGMIDSVITVGVVLSVAVGLSLYGSHRAWFVRTIGSIAAMPCAVAVSPFAGDRPIEWNSPTVLGVLPQMLLIAAVMRALYVTLVRQEEANARDGVLARTGSRLLGVTDVEHARSIGREAVTELAALCPGVAVAVLTVSEDDAVVVAEAGFADAVTGTAVPAGALTAVVEGAETADGLGILGAKGIRCWRAAPLITRNSARFLLAGAARPVEEGVFDAFRSVAHQVMLAEASCLTHAELDHRANHDHLTTLPTRARFFRQLAEAVDSGAETVALLNIDLDDFKTVNDSYGHGAGDELLIEVAARLAEAGGPGSIAARFGGDEFALLVRGITDDADAVRIAEAVCKRIVAPMRLSVATVSIGASIGVAVSEAGLTAGDLVRGADIAMYSAKARGRNRVERFTAEHHGGIANHRMLEEHLGEAAGRGEIVLLYQPMTDLRTGACVAVEALAHWQHPVLGLLPPAAFLPHAERTGKITELGTHILREACRQLAAWSAFTGADGVRMNVNVSAHQALDPRFAETVSAVLAETGLPADRLTLEIVESERMDDGPARVQLREVAALGVRIALDDFGTGYVSLASLRSYPIHQIKIDPAFLRPAEDDAALRLLISVGEVLGTETVAQGLSSASEADRLRSTVVTSGQGPLIAEPMPAEAFALWMSAQRSLS